MKKVFTIIAALALVGIIAGAGFGSAADLKVQGGTIQAGADYDLAMYSVAEVCGWGLETDTGLVSFVRISFNAPNPVGGDNELSYFVQITNAAHDVIATSSKNIVFPVQPVSNYNLTCEVFNFNVPVKACDIADIHVFVEGSANSGPTTPICPDLP